MKTKIVPAEKLTGSLRAKDYFSRWFVSRCSSSIPEGEVYYAVVEITAKLIESLKSRRKAFQRYERKDSNLYSLEYFDSIPQYFDRCPCIDPLSSEWQNSYRIQTEEPTYVNLASQLAVSCETLILTEHGVHWRCFIKHSPEQLDTAVLPWEEVKL